MSALPPPSQQNVMGPTSPSSSEPAELQMTRRRMLAIAGGGAVLAGTAVAARHLVTSRAPVFVARNQHYDGPLATTIREGLQASGMRPAMFRNTRVLLKPNLVEPMRGRPQMTTHPAVVAAALEVFREWGAIVGIGEAPGHVRDSDMALQVSGMDQALRETKTKFSDLNYQEVRWVRNQGRWSSLKGFYFPQSVAEADYVVSMPKMKTHHWMGVTASMKNLYGTLPGIKYGWPKNVLHHAGIPQTVVDINMSIRKTIAIVDGIDCMEGDGPILGTVKRMGLLVVGPNVRSVDATVSRIMGLAPERIPYLALAHAMGPIEDNEIDQVGERWQELVNPFKILDRPHLRGLRATDDGPLVT